MLRNKKLRQRIELLLAQYPHCRDDDQRLMCNVWQQELLEKIGPERYMEETIYRREVIGEIMGLSNPESIRRTRQKIQELKPLLRGKTYKARQRHQGTVKKEIRAFK